MSCTTCGPPSASASKTVRARASRRSALFVRMRSRTRPRAISAMRSATASAIVLTALAPIASRTSTIRCATTYVLLGVSTSRTDSSRMPPPKRVSIGSWALASSMSSARASNSRKRAALGSATSTTCTCACMMGSVLEVKNPPRTRAMRAALLAAAMTEGSSVAIGHQEVALVDREVQGYPQGDAQDTDSVLDHMGSLLEGRTLFRPQCIERRRIEPGGLDQQLVSGIDLKVTKSSEPARTDHGDYLSSTSTTSLPVAR